MNAPANPFASLGAVLDEMAHVLAQMTPEEFTGSGVPGLSGSIGGHVRHCLDHILALERAIETGVADYDARRRCTTVETNRELAVLSLMAAARRLAVRGESVLGRPVVVRALTAQDGVVVESRSSVGRELVFVISHTIHHNAQVALLAHRLGVSRMPPRFGLAPATPALMGAA